MIPQVSAKVDPSEVIEGFKRTAAATPQVMKRMVARTVLVGKTKARKGTIRKSGELKKSYFSKTRKTQKGKVYGYIVNRADHASTQEFGNVIVPKKGKYLTFKIGDQWVKATQVKIPAKSYFFPTLDRYFSSSAPATEMERILMKEIVKIWGN